MSLDKLHYIFLFSFVASGSSKDYNKFARMKKQLLITLSILLFLFLGTGVAIFYGKGYHFSLDSGKPGLAGTGLLVATSSPDGAEVFVNGHLTTATDNTINLAPGDYVIKIAKDGYFPWEKRIKIQKEVVSKAEALLFPTAPKLENITTIGVKNPIMDPSLTKIAYAVASESARKNGVYVLDITTRPILTLQSSSTQIADDTVDLFSKAYFSWSPDGKQLVATVSAETKATTTYLLETSNLNQNPKDVTEVLPSIHASWEKDKNEKEKSRLETLKGSLQKMISDNFNIISWSPDETKLLYRASSSGTLSFIIKPRLTGIDSIPEERTITKGALYIYDTKEDKNYKLNLEDPPYIVWFQDSKHLIYIVDKRIKIVEYDGTNDTTVYAGPFEDKYVFPSLNTSKIIILTNLGNSTIGPNLYSLDLK